MQSMTRYLRMVDPVVQHGMREIQQGASVEHTLRETALIAAMVGAGIDPSRAIAQVERAEATLLGPSPAAEYGAPVGYGKQMPMTYGKQMPAAYGKQMPGAYGKQMPTMVAPYGQTWRGY